MVIIILFSASKIKTNPRIGSNIRKVIINKGENNKKFNNHKFAPHFLFSEIPPLAIVPMNVSMNKPNF